MLDEVNHVNSVTGVDQRWPGSALLSDQPA